MDLARPGSLPGMKTNKKLPCNIDDKLSFFRMSHRARGPVRRGLACRAMHKKEAKEDKEANEAKESQGRQGKPRQARKAKEAKGKGALEGLIRLLRAP